MCEKCDAGFAAMSDEEIRAEANDVAALVASVMVKVEPSPGGAVAVTAVGHALITAMREGFEVVPGESMTPAMIAVAEKLGGYAADIIRQAYAQDFPRIVAPAPGRIVLP